MSLVAVDLFSGSGGTTSGLKKAGIPIVAAIEIDAQAAKTYKYNNPEVKMIVDDIRTISGEMIKQMISVKKGDHLLLVACPPCQGFSSIRRNGAGDVRNQLVFEYLRLILELQPEFLLMENVAGMSVGIGKDIFKKFLSQVKSHYQIVFNVLNAADYGVPQTRKRLVLHGIRHDLTNGKQIIELPTPTHSKCGIEGKKRWKTAAVILGLPHLEAGETIEDPINGIFNHVANNLSPINVERIQWIREHGGNRASLPPRLTENWHRNLSLHTDVYGILDIKKPAITITGGCMNYSKGRFGHPIDNRALSAREAARLQSFDDSYRFFGNKTQLASQIGNAVPVKLAEASGKYFIKLELDLESGGVL